jgi:2,4-dienoyl-CoA reductase-like NADH-dependent reductase (Old Yellow Enzyme family)
VAEPGPKTKAAMTPFEPARLGPLTLRNRFIKAATFEGSSPRGQVTDALVDFHRRVGEGGAAMTTVAYLAVSPEGRTDRHCIYTHDDVLPGLRRLTDAVHGTGAAVAAQLGHAGPVANSRSNRAPALSPPTTGAPRAWWWMRASTASKCTWATTTSSARS